MKISRNNRMIRSELYNAVFRNNAAELYSRAKAIVSTEQGGGGKKEEEVEEEENNKEEETGRKRRRRRVNSQLQCSLQQCSRVALMGQGNCFQ